MLDGVIENPSLANLELTRGAADAKGTLGWNDQRQVNGDASIGHAGVRGDLGIRIQNGEKSRGGAARDVSAGRVRDRSHGLGAASNMRRLRFSLIPQEIGTPTSGAIEFLPLIDGQSRRIIDIGLQSRP